MTFKRQDFSDALWATGTQALARLPELKGSAAVNTSPQQGLLALSPFIARVLERDPEALTWQDDRVQLTAPEAYAEVITTALAACETETQLQTRLRGLRNRFMAEIAAADLLGQLSLRTTLQHLSVLADSFISATLAWLMRFYTAKFGTPMNASGAAQPLLVIGMGKLGGGELNFSSDIDLIFCFPEQGQTEGAKKSIENNVFFTKLAQALVAALDAHTADGFVFRVDLRLRPFGSSGPLVASFAAIEHYYQEHGRDWERYAMVKARLIGADADFSHQLEAMLRPFVYRRYIDFSVIDALRKMKALIRQEARRRQLQNNIKLGPGGIREVEFIAQAFQLIRGGQERRLQTRSIYQALEMIEALELLQSETVARLVDGYEYLRKVEHVLQQIDDQQTQQLPSDPLDQERLAIALGYADWPQTEQRIFQAMADIHAIFKAVIGDEEEADEHEGISALQLLWQDLTDDDAAVELITEHLDADRTDNSVQTSQAVWQQLKNFRQDIRKRGSGPRGRKAIAKLMPLLLEPILKGAEPERLLERILQVLHRVASRTAYLELLIENPGACDQLLKLCRASGWIAKQIAAYPLLLDELIDPQHLYQLPAFSEYPRLIDEYLLRIPEQDLETQMDVLRQARQALQLKVAAADVSGALPIMKVSDHLSYLAEALIADGVQLAWQQLASKHGTPPGRSIEDTGFAVMAYGKLGGLELGYGSDLDLVFISDADYSGQTDGEKPLEVQQFYLRLAQRILHIFTIRTMTGTLYEVDMRLRPSGKAGLLVSRLDSYQKYLQEEAWTWEHQALVRARPVYGPPRLREQLKSLRDEILSQPRDAAKLAQHVVEMREKMRGHMLRQQAGRFDLKQGLGGITDIEFLVQYLVLAYACKHPKLAEFTDNIRILERAATLQLLSESLSQQLIDSYQKLRELQHRLALDEQAALTDQDLSQVTAVVTQAWNDLFAGVHAE